MAEVLEASLHPEARPLHLAQARAQLGLAQALDPLGRLTSQLQQTMGAISFPIAYRHNSLY
jgi:hypothetical protein